MLLLGTLLEPLLAALAQLVSRMLKGTQARDGHAERDAKFVVRGSGFEVQKASNLTRPAVSRVSCALQQAAENSADIPELY